MSCQGIICAINATCHAISSFEHQCLCNEGYEGDGYVECHPDAFEHFTLMLVIVIVLFLLLLTILFYFLCKQKILDAVRPNDPYDINWRKAFNAMKDASQKRYQNVSIVVHEEDQISITEEKIEDEIKQASESENELPTVTKEDLQEQKSKLRPSDSTKRVAITLDDEDDDDDEEGSQGIVNLAFEDKNITIESDVAYEEIDGIELTSFKPLPEASTPETSQKNQSNLTTPPPYSSKESFKRDAPSPRIQPKRMIIDETNTP